MVDEDPFAEPDDTDKTVIKPNPGGRRTPAATPSAQPAAPVSRPTHSAPVGVPGGGAGYGVPNRPSEVAKPAASTNVSLDTAMTGMNALNACATPLFSLVSRIRNRAQHMDPDTLRQKVVGEVREFENRALQAGIPAQTVKVARYAICATLDDVVLNTPWGSDSIWAQQSMVGTFHRETVGGDRFYDLLARLEQDPGNNIDLLEFMYMCLSLGFEGRLRVEQGGSDKHLQIRLGLARIIRGQRGPVEHDVSSHWEGLDKPHKPLSMWKPVWIAMGSIALLLALGFTGFSWALNNSTERVSGQLSVLDTGIVPELKRRAPPPPEGTTVVITEEQIEQVERIKGFLEEEIEQKLVSVFHDANTITVRIAGSGLFGSGSDQLKSAYEEPIGRVARAVNDEPGPVIIVGHSDNVPIRSARFPSNMHLSLARAESVMKAISKEFEDPGRLKAEGRADKDPIDSNDTREGRAKNRRIEVVLVKSEDG